MNRTICCKHAAFWLFCILVAGLAPSGLGQYALPPLMPVNVSNFTIPFEIGGSDNVIREVELLVSKDRGRRWHSAARQPVETGKFAFRADTDGEYWFAFRTITLTGNVSPMVGQPALRVLVDTGNPILVSPARSNDSGPILPPKPERFRPEKTPPPTQPSQTQTQPVQTEIPKESEPETKPEGKEPEPEAKPEKTNAAKPAQMLVPKFPGFDIPEAVDNPDGDLLDDLLSGMSAFMDVQPVVRSAPDSQVTDNVPASSPPSSSAPAGSIAGIDLTTEGRPQIIVRWNPGAELWNDAQIDVLRSGSAESSWIPIAINLRNNGEYWWYLSPEDLKPFYIAVRIRSLHGGSSVDVTQKRIEIDPRLAVFQSQRP